MRRISSRATFFYKRIAAIIWFGVLGLFLVSTFLGGSSSGTPPMMSLILPIAVAIIGYLFTRRLIFDLVDEVWDAGDALVVRNKGQEERVALSDIMNVSYSALMNASRVTLSLRQPCAFGTEVSFCPPLRLNPMLGNPVVDELIRRIDATRRT
jgi:hypothetical protein